MLSRLPAAQSILIFTVLVISWAIDHPLPPRCSGAIRHLLSARPQHPPLLRRSHPPHRGGRACLRARRCRAAATPKGASFYARRLRGDLRWAKAQRWAGACPGMKRARAAALTPSAPAPFYHVPVVDGEGDSPGQAIASCTASISAAWRPGTPSISSKAVLAGLGEHNLPRTFAGCARAHAAGNHQIRGLPVAQAPAGLLGRLRCWSPARRQHQHVRPAHSGRRLRASSFSKRILMRGRHRPGCAAPGPATATTASTDEVHSARAGPSWGQRGLIHADGRRGQDHTWLVQAGRRSPCSAVAMPRHQIACDSLRGCR